MNKDKHPDETIVGYSGFILFEQCYEYIENACFVAASFELAHDFLLDCGYDRSDYRVDEVSIRMLRNDYGYSLGEYALEEVAFKKFKQVADEHNIAYSYEAWYLDETVIIVNI